MVTTCCVVGCKTRAKKGNGIGFYKFPKRDLERRKLWIRAVKRPNWAPTEADRICSLHFVEGRPCHNLTNHPDWVPSIFYFNKKSPETVARNYGRFKRSHKRLKRFNPAQDSATCNVPAATPTANSQASVAGSSSSSPVTTSTATTIGQHVDQLGSWMTPVVSQAVNQAIQAYNQGALGGSINNAGDAPAFFVCYQDGVGIRTAPSFPVDSKKKVLLLLDTRAQAAPATSEQATGVAGTVAGTATPHSGNTESLSMNPSLLSANLTTASVGREMAAKAPPKPGDSRTCSRASESTLSASEAEGEASRQGTSTPPKYAGPSQSKGSQAKAKSALKKQVSVPSILRRGTSHATLNNKKVFLVLKSGVTKAPPSAGQTTPAVASTAATTTTTTVHIIPPVEDASLYRSDPPQLSNIDSEATLSASEGEGDDEVPAPCPKERLALLSTSAQTEENKSPCKSCQRLQKENKRLRRELALLKQKHAACTPANSGKAGNNSEQL
ncbi:uncharacterized protein LOC144158769 isoform X2 [Haemaphysalis longicornis]